MTEVDEQQSVPWDPRVPRDLSFLFSYGSETPIHFNTQYPECNVIWYCEYCGEIFAVRMTVSGSNYHQYRSTTCMSCLMNGKPVYSHPHFLAIPESVLPSAPAHMLALDFLHEATWLLRRLKLV